MTFEANDNIIMPFRDRIINSNHPVQVYRNLKASKKLKMYSIRQNGLVVAHTPRICLRDCKFVVRESSRRRFLETGHKTVHAWIEGKITSSGMGTTAARNDLVKFKYNPKTDIGFMHNITINPKAVKSAAFVICNEDGVGAAYFY